MSNLLNAIKMLFTFNFPWADFDFFEGREVRINPSVRGEIESDRPWSN